MIVPEQNNMVNNLCVDMHGRYYLHLFHLRIMQRIVGDFLLLLWLEQRESLHFESPPATPPPMITHIIDPC